MTTQIEKTLSSIPKAELHVHLEGAIPIPTVLELSQKNNFPLNHIFTKVGDELSYKWGEDFSKFLFAYDEVCKVIKSCLDYKIAISAYLDQCLAENVIYSEIIISPSHVESLGIAYPDFVETLEEVASIFEKKGLIVRYIATFIRQDGVEAAYNVLELLKNNLSNYIVGINLAGNENHGEIKDFTPIFKASSDLGLFLTAHAGEIRGSTEVQLAIEHLNISRLGHATSAILDPSLVDLIVERGICVESCPTSNIQTGAHFRTYKQHPFRKYFDCGVALTINSDDPPFFNTTIGNEYLVAKNEFNFNENELIQLTKNSIKHAFVSEDIKSKLLQKINGAS